jgi:transcriptional regulator GlxA family with amidase domain
MCLIHLVLSDSTDNEVTPEVESADRQVDVCIAAHRRLKKLLEYLEQHPSQRLTTAAAAKAVCFQTNYFCSFFKRETGCTFVSWQRAWRVARIAEVLLSENVSITRAAERYGYLNMRAFERAFKAVYQVSAREFRRAYRVDEKGAERKRRRLSVSSQAMRCEIGDQVQ